MSTVLEPVFQDESVLFTADAGTINLRDTRYIFLPISFITKKRQHDFKGKDRDAGGEELTSPCLWRTRRFLRRGRISPLEVGTAWHTKDELDATSREMAARNGKIRRADNPHTGLETGPVILYGVDVFPGDEILTILATDETNGGFSRGGVEITALRGRGWKNDSPEYGDSEMYQLQQLLFPTYPVLPPTLRELQELIVRAGERPLVDAERRLLEAFALDTVEDIALEGIDACEQSRLWGTNFVEMENQRIQSRVGQAGFVHTYTDMAKVIMAQLEIEPLTIAQHKERAAQVSAAEIGAAVAAAIREPQENKSTLDVLKAAVAEDPEGFKALFAELIPKNKGGRPSNAELEERRKAENVSTD